MSIEGLKPTTWSIVYVMLYTRLPYQTMINFLSLSLCQMLDDNIVKGATNLLAMKTTTPLWVWCISIADENDTIWSMVYVKWCIARPYHMMMNSFSLPLRMSFNMYIYIVLRSDKFVWFEWVWNNTKLMVHTNST